MTKPTLPDDWPLLSRLLDEALAVSPGERASWLSNLDGEAAACRQRLVALLAREGEAAARGFLETPPDFTLPGASEADGEADALHAPNELVGPWRLMRLLGQGGMAEVWLAERADGSLARSVALKLPLPGFATGRMAGRFARERNLLAGLNHPRIASLYDAGTAEGGRPWLAMEAIDGRPLTQWCDEERAPLAKRIDLLLQVCEAVQYAHGRLVVHRDIKPNNILVTAEGELRLLDFGIAKLLQVDNPAAPARTSLTQVSGRPMTPDWASPEQVRGEEPGIGADVYAVGVLAYRLFAGIGPYELSRATVAALETAILDQEPRLPSARVADRKLKRALRGDLDTIVLRALKKVPEDRYPTIDALATDLRRHLAGLPVLARPSSWRYRAGRYMQRNRWAVAGGVVVASSLIVGSVIAFLQAQAARAEAARSQAMYKFVLDLFNPGGRTSVDGRIRDRKMSEVIADAAQRAGTALADVPQAREELLTNLTELTRGIGLLDASERLRLQRVDLMRALYGDDSDQVLKAEAESVLTLSNSGHRQESLALAESLLARCDRRLCADATRARLLAAAGDVGMTVHPAPWPLEQRRLLAALALFQKEPDQSSFLANGFDALVNLEVNIGDLAGAVRHAQQALEMARAAYGEDGWVTARSKQQLGNVERQLGHPARSTELLRESIATMTLQWGDQSNDTSRARLILVDTLRPSRFRAEAMQQARAAVAELQSDKNSDQQMLRHWAREALLTLDVRRGAATPALRACEQWFSEVVASQSQLQTLRSCTEISTAMGSPHSREWTDSLSVLVKTEYGDVPVARWVRLVGEAELAVAERRHEDADKQLAAAWSIRVPGRPDIAARWLFDNSLNVIALSAARNATAATASRNEALAEVQATIDSLPEGEDADYFVESRALLLEARGRLRLAAGSADLATDDLRASLALRETIDDSNGIWLRRNLQALMESLQAQGDSRGSRAVRERIARIDLAARATSEVRATHR